MKTQSSNQNCSQYQANLEQQISHCKPVDQNHSKQNSLDEGSQKQNKCRQQRQLSINSQFQRYSIKEQSIIKKVTQHKNLYQFQKLKNDNLKPNINDSKQTYKDWKVYNNKSDLNILPFPYFVDHSIQIKKPHNSPFSLLYFSKNLTKQNVEVKQKHKFISPLYKLKVQNKVQVYNENLKQNKVYKPYFNYQKTPINEYLNFDLSEQINTGLREVQIMAEQIKRIKKTKKVQNHNMQVIKGKQNKSIRIRKSYVKNYDGLYKSQSDVIKC